MAVLYWVGGTGNWSSTNTINWSTSSGGPGGASIPGPSDTVYFDSNSGNGTCTLTTTGNCQNLFITSTNMTITGASSVMIYSTVNINSTGGNFNNLDLYFLVNGTSGSFTSNRTIQSIGSSFGAGTTFNFLSNVTTTGSISINTSTNGSFGNTAIYLNGRSFNSFSGNISLAAGAYNNGIALIGCSNAQFTAVNGGISISTSGSGAGGGVAGIGTTQGNSLTITAYSGGSGQITSQSSTSTSLYGFNGVTVTNSGSGNITLGRVWAELSNASISLTKNSSGAVSIETAYFAGNLSVGTGVTVQYAAATALATNGKTFTINGSVNFLYFTNYAGASSVTSATLTGTGSVNYLSIDFPYTTVNIGSNFTATSLFASGSSPGSLSITGVSSPRTLTSTSYALSNITWTNITAAGTIPFTGTGFVDGGGNTNIQFAVPGSSLFFGSNF